MSRDPKLYLQDFLDCAQWVMAYTQGMDWMALEANSLVVDAVLRNLEILGEAAKRSPVPIKAATPEGPWKMICGFRDHRAHGYSGIDQDLVWDGVVAEVPSLVSSLNRLPDSGSGSR